MYVILFLTSDLSLTSMKRLLVLLRIIGEKILTKSSPRGFARKEILVLDIWHSLLKHQNC